MHREELCLKYLVKLESNENYNNLNVLGDSHDLTYFSNDKHPKPVGIRRRSLKENLDITTNSIKTTYHLDFPHGNWKTLTFVLRELKEKKPLLLQSKRNNHQQNTSY